MRYQYSFPKYRYFVKAIAFSVVVIWAAIEIPFVDAAEAKKPNILMIVADDLGFTDIGAFGSEIKTPNLDAIALSGTRLVNFHATPICSTTRAQLLTGVDHHLAGFGTLAEFLHDNQKGQPGYEGGLNARVVTVAELLRDAGYRTIISGKWHLGYEPKYDPSAHGFDSSFVLAGGGHNHFGKDVEPDVKWAPVYRENGEETKWPDNRYSSDHFVSKLLMFLAKPKQKEQPFFAYLSFTAPHDPLQAPADDISRYAGVYDAGPEVFRKQRLKTAKRLGIIPEDVEPHTTIDTTAPWSELSSDAKRIEARRMEIYAAMIDRLDQNVGRVIQYLKKIRELDNTVIVFLSDNGPHGISLDLSTDPKKKKMAEWRNQLDNSYSSMGTSESFVTFGPDWAQAVSAPFRLFKAFPTEGGIRTAAFINDPRQKSDGRIERGYISVLDLVPTILDWAGVAAPSPTYKGRKVYPVTGKSLVSLLRDRGSQVHDSEYVEGWEIFGRRAIRQGKWKAVYLPVTDRPWGGKGRWELFDIVSDPSEIHDLSDQNPKRTAHMVKLWEGYARQNGVIIPEM